MATKSFDIEEATRSFGKVVEVVSQGGEVILYGTDQRPVAKVVPFRERRAGLHSGAAQVSDDFDAPLTDEFWSGEE